MSDSNTWNTAFLEIMISSENERVFNHDFSHHTVHIIIDAWWASIKVGSNHPIGSNNSQHASSWQFYWHCWIEEAGCHEILYTICHQVRHNPSGQWTSSMRKHLGAEAHIAKLNKLTESEVTELTSWRLMIQLWTSWRGREVEELQWSVRRGNSYLTSR